MAASVRAADKTLTFRIVTITIAVLALSFSPSGAQARLHSNKAAAAVGEVHFIRHHLLVQPPGKRAGRGRIQQALFNQYRAATGRGDLASIAFRDGTLLHFNQNTDATFRSPSLTYVKKGFIDQQVAPGTNHRVRSATAIASAVGTNFGLQITGKKSLYFVLEGSLLVQNRFGSVYVQNGQATTVTKGKPPRKPVHFDAAKALKWVSQLPPIRPPPDPNIALAANGGQIVGTPSQDDSAGAPAGAIDGRLDRGWASAAGQVTSQSLKLGFSTKGPYFISAVALSTRAFATYPAASAVQHFQILVSTTGTQDGDFEPILSDVAKEQNRLLRFKLRTPTDARYVELLGQDNFGDPQHLNVTELEVIGHPDPKGLEKVVSPCVFVEPCAAYLLGLLNGARHHARLPPFSLNDTLSFGTSSCAGALGHSIDMGMTQTLWHQNSRFPTASYPNDVCLKHTYANENVGTANSGDEIKDIRTIYNSQIHEPHDSATCNRMVANHIYTNHACNILDTRVNRIGIGLFFDGAATWLTITFIN